MFKPGVFVFLLFVSFACCQHPDSLVYNEPEVTLIGKLYCGLGKTFCASVILRQEGVPYPEEFGKVQTRCTSGESLSHTLTFVLNHRYAPNMFKFSNNFYHNCTDSSHTFWYRYPFGKFFIYDKQPPFVYDLDLTNYRTISNRHAFNNTDVADSPLVTSFKINEASGEVLENDAEFRKLIKMG
ncbi:unnamed protein product [Caenorhabditis brenneri]